MKKLLIAFTLLCVSIFCFSQNQPIQLKRWYFAPKNIDMTQPVPAASTIPNSVAHVANGVYDRANPGGLPTFYIADNSIFDGNGNPILGGSLDGTIETDEIAVTPFPDNAHCQQNKYYIFYLTKAGMSLWMELKYVVIDMNANNGNGSCSSPTTIYYFSSTDYGGIALGHMSSSQSQYLYAVGGNPIVLAPN